MFCGGAERPFSVFSGKKVEGARQIWEAADGAAAAKRGTEEERARQICLGNEN